MRLRSRFDANDHFMSGHGVVKARTYKRKTPTWVFDDQKVQGLILRSFPKAKSSKTQREGAARWAAVIHLYFRLGYTASQVADEINSTTTKVEFVVRSIYRVSKGRSANGSGLLGAKRGRPRKNS